MRRAVRKCECKVGRLQRPFFIAPRVKHTADAEPKFIFLQVYGQR